MAESLRCVLCGADDFERIYRHPTRSVVSGACRRCGLGYLSPRPSEQESEALYARYRQAYPDTFLADPEGPFARAARERAAFAASRLAPGARVIEIGCGYGHFLKEMAARGHPVAGIDPSEHQVGFATQRLGVARALVGSLEDLPPRGDADLIALFHVIEHLRDPMRGLRQAAAALRPGGLALLDLPNLLRLPCDAIEHWYVASGQHLFTFTPRVLVAMASAAGLEPVYVAQHPLPSIYAANLRLLARRVDAPSRAPALDPSETFRSLHRHHDALAELGRRLSAQVATWRSSGRRVAVYGGGFHTLGLLDLCRLGPREIEVIVDDDRAKWGEQLEGIGIDGPKSLRSRGIGAVLISSLAAEHKMLERLRALKIPDLEIAPIYGEPVAAREPRLVYRGEHAA